MGTSESSAADGRPRPALVFVAPPQAADEGLRRCFSRSTCRVTVMIQACTVAAAGAWDPPGRGPADGVPSRLPVDGLSTRGSC